MYQTSLVTDQNELEACSSLFGVSLDKVNFLTKDRWGFLVQVRREKDGILVGTAIVSLNYTFYQGPVAAIDRLKILDSDASTCLLQFLDNFFYEKLGLIKVRYRMA